MRERLFACVCLPVGGAPSAQLLAALDESEGDSGDEAAPSTAAGLAALPKPPAPPSPAPRFCTVTFTVFMFEGIEGFCSPCHLLDPARTRVRTLP